MIEAEQSANPRQRRIWLKSVLTGALWSGVAVWLTSLLLVAALMIAERYHPFVFIFSFVAVPVLTLLGPFLGAVCGGALALRRERTSAWPPQSSQPLRRQLLRGVAVLVGGTIAIVIGSTIWGIIEHRPVGQLASLGGSFIEVAGVVRFPEGKLRDADLPAVVDCLNRMENRWDQLVLDGTAVSADGLRHLHSLRPHPGYCLVVANRQVDDRGTGHLRKMPDVAALFVAGPPPSEEAQERLKRQLPNIGHITFSAEKH